MARIAITAAAFAANFIPGVGPFISAGIMIGGNLALQMTQHQNMPPKLLDRQIMSSANDAPILFGYGSQRVSGEVVWSTGLEVIRKGSSDFTSFQDAAGNYIPTTQAYITNVAMVFGEGPAAVTRLWYDSKLVYDTRGTSYRGTWITFPSTSEDFVYKVNDVVLDPSVSTSDRPVYFICIQNLPAIDNSDYPHENQQFWAQIDAFYNTSTGQILYRYGFVNNPTFQAAYDISLTDSGLNILDVDPSNYINPKFYPGDENQMPDPLMESQIGVGKTSAMRGLCYMVLENFVVWDFGNRLPNIRAEIVWDAANLYPKTQVPVTAGEERLEIDIANRRVHLLDSTHTKFSTLDMATALEGAQVTVPGVLNAAFAVDSSGYVWMSHDNAGTGNLLKIDPTTYAVLQTIVMPANVFPEQINCGHTAAGVSVVACGMRKPSSGAFHVEVYRTTDGFHVGGADIGDVGGHTYGEWFMYPVFDISSNMWFILPRDEGSPEHFEIWKVAIGATSLTATLVNTIANSWEGESLCCAWFGGENKLILPTANGYLAFYDIGSDTYGMMVSGTIPTPMWDTSDFAAAYSGVHACGGNRLWGGYFKIPYTTSNHIIASWSCVAGAIKVASTNFFGSLFIGGVYWTGVNMYDLDSFLGDGWAGLVYYTDGNQMWTYDPNGDLLVVIDNSNSTKFVDFLQLDRNTTATEAVDEIVTDICTRTGMSASQIDVSQLAGLTLGGYTVARPAPAKSILAPLAQFFLFDVVETDTKLKFVRRPQAVSLTIPEDDLGLINDKGRLEKAVLQEEDFPQEISVGYQDPALNYQTGHQRHTRSIRVVKSREKIIMEFPMAVTSYQARQAAIKWMKQFWYNRYPFMANLWKKYYLLLDSTDVVEMVDGDSTFVARILTGSMGQDYTSKLALTTDQPSIYTTSGAAGGGVGGSNSGSGDTGGIGGGSTGGNGGGSGGTGGSGGGGGGGITTPPGIPVDIGWYLNGPLPGDYEILRLPMDRVLTFPLSLSGSSANAEVAATSDTSLLVKRNGTTVGSINFAAGSNVGTFTFQAAVIFAIGDVLSVVAPTVADATLSSVSGIFATTR